MSVNVETVSTLERRVKISVPFTQINAEVDVRLKKVARTAKVQGFRPGKAPLNIVAQQYGLQVREDVLNETVGSAFTDVVREQELKVAGYPRFEPVEGEPSAESFEFSATFEVYPEIKLGDLAEKAVEKPVAEVSEEAVDKTIDVLRKQRVNYETTDAAAEDGDRVVVDFLGKIDDVAFAGGSANDFAFQLGQGQMLPEFENAARGLKAGESKVFDLSFPEDYHGKDVAGKTAQFEITVKSVAKAVLPEVDAEFAKTLGVADGDVEKMKGEIRENVTREVTRRLKTKVKENVLQALLDVTPIDLPTSLVSMEVNRLVEQTKKDFQSRGMDVNKMPFPPEIFTKEAERRVALGLILSDLVDAESLRATPEQVRSVIDDFAASYEQPEDVVRWYYADPSRLEGPESLATEDNVVAWVLSRAKVEEKALSFDELMGQNNA
ncbi:trigger factor [Leeia sp. TBRC 13508]|uniref:Trigger factor n=1 Tax=Leeia speluncae TaxID=2884804 RepID=A0ABS8D4G3_9NEIS|nr:trigger factor [Leeia speluncae]MCB6183104.1 trigger factor [Leeia speluncae]